MTDDDGHDEIEWVTQNDDETRTGERVANNADEAQAADDSEDPAFGEGSADKQGEAPLSDLADRVRGRDTTPDEDLFVEADTTEVDPEAVWEQLESEEPATDDGPDHEPESRVVEKASYCETCPYFDAPPAMRCTHEGTEIRQLIDFDHVEVYNCPIVRQNDELEQR